MHGAGSTLKRLAVGARSSGAPGEPDLPAPTSCQQRHPSRALPKFAFPYRGADKATYSVITPPTCHIGAGVRLPQRGLRIDLREGGAGWAGLSFVRSSVRNAPKGPKRAPKSLKFH